MLHSMTAHAADLLSLPLTRMAVVLVDFQNDFCSPAAGNGGTPTNTHNEAAAQRANVFAAEASRLGAHIIYTQQVLDWKNMPPRQQRWEVQDGLCAVGTWGAELYLDPVPRSTVVVKHRFDCWQSTAFTDELLRRNIDGLVICGVELVCCVLYAVLGAGERGYHYVIPTDLISGQDFGDATDNQAVRDYFRHNQPEHLTNSQDLLAAWRDLASARNQ
jgi:nicotinamidase-related amidase